MATSPTTTVQYHHYCVCLKEKTHSAPACTWSLPPSLVLGLQFDVILSVNTISGKEKNNRPHLLNTKSSIYKAGSTFSGHNAKVSAVTEA